MDSNGCVALENQNIVNTEELEDEEVLLPVAADLHPITDEQHDGGKHRRPEHAPAQRATLLRHERHEKHRPVRDHLDCSSHD